MPLACCRGEAFDMNKHQVAILRSRLQLLCNHMRQALRHHSCERNLSDVL